jgi:acyl-coenzyme A synthetase/AMP-(fatty) acid ligase
VPLEHPLVRLLADEPDEPSRSGRRVAFDDSGGSDFAMAQARTLADLRGDVFALAAQCRNDRGRCWLVECDDAYRVAVVLLAAAVTGARVALPPNHQPATLRELRAECERVFGDDGDAIDPLELSRSSDAGASAQPAADRDAPAMLRVDRDAPLVELFTSGTSGPGKRIVKALRHLEDEVVELERTIGESIAADAAIVATVPAQHLYGLLFRVLWPLASGRAFPRSSVLLPEEMFARLDGRPPSVVVSSPAHLRHLAASPRLRRHAHLIAEMISSGGPLETATALRLEELVGFAPREVFGSTETGGVAWRRASRFEPSPRWAPFAPVEIHRDDDGALVVTSPFVTPPAQSGETGPGFRMGDRVEIEDGGFRLLGRSDRVVKVGEKTLSLPEIEEFLATHACVREAAIGTFKSSGSARLGALVVLTPEGLRQLAELGRRSLSSRLAAHLAERWDRVALPRRWRFVAALPADERGKVAASAVADALTAPAGALREALLLDELRDAEGLRAEFVVPRDLAYLAGHYDAFPLVPGVVQVQWVIGALRRMLGRPVSVRSMEALKFKSVLRPAQVFTMRIAADEAAKRATFSLAHEARVFSSGRLRWDDAP